MSEPNYTHFTDAEGKRRVACDQEICDFCLGPGPFWAYPAGEMYLLGHAVFNKSDDAWAACQHCHELLEADDIEGLVQYTVDAQRRHAPPGIDHDGRRILYPPRSIGVIVQRENIRRFVSVRSGPPVREAP